MSQHLPNPLSLFPLGRYSVFIQTSGYVFGWVGLATSEVGTLLGGVVGFYLSRYWLKAWAQDKIKSFHPNHRKLITIARQSMSSGRGSIFFFSSIRMTPALTFGWVNGLCGAMTEMKLGLYMWVLTIFFSFFLLAAALDHTDSQDADLVSFFYIFLAVHG